MNVVSRYILLFKLFFLVGMPSLVLSQTKITEPEAIYLSGCKEYTLKWELHNWNTDRSDVLIVFNGFSDENSDGILEERIDYEVANVELEESCRWCETPTEFTFRTGVKWTGNITAKVTSRRRGSSWAFQSESEKRYFLADNNLYQPLPNGYVFCEPEEYKVEPKFQVIVYEGEFIFSNTKVANWYYSETSSTIFHRGPSYTGFFGEGLTTYYVSYSYNTGDCTAESDRVPISVYVMPNDIVVETYGEIQPEPDNRLNEPECSRNGTYYDLEADPILTLQSLGLSNSISGVSTSFTVNTGDWQSQPFGTSENSHRVCNIHLPSGLGTDKQFTKEVDVNVLIEIDDPRGDGLILSSSGQCKRTLQKTTVSKDRACSPNWSDAITIYQTDPFDCGSDVQTISICPNSSSLIGPQDQSSGFFSRLFKYSYNWIPEVGLKVEEETKRNPKIYYDDVTLPPGQHFIKYTCEVSRQFVFGGDPTISYFCVYLYKCPDCVNGQTNIISQLDILDEYKFADSNTEKDDEIKIYPIPANTVLNIEQEFLEGSVVSIYLENLMNKEFQMNQNLIGDGKAKVHKIDVSQLPNGAYYYQITIDGSVVQRNKLIIEHL
jgi:hypothetical protein